MRRYASIDFLRGLAIFLMLNLHTIMFMLDIDQLVGIIDQIEVLQLLASRKG